jgi:hypothetical protein
MAASPAQVRPRHGKIQFAPAPQGDEAIQHGAGAQYFWKWSIDTVIPMRAFETSGRGKDRADCMRQFKEASTRAT